MLWRNHLSRFVLLAGLAISLGLLVADKAQAAGIVGYRNDTNQVIVVQTSMVVNNVIRRSKPQTLYPGEVALDGLTGAGTRQVTIYDSKKPTTPLFREDVVVKDDAFFSIQADNTVMVKGQTTTPPKIKLVSIPTPTSPKPAGPKPGNPPTQPGPGPNPPKKP